MTVDVYRGIRGFLSEHAIERTFKGENWDVINEQLINIYGLEWQKYFKENYMYVRIRNV